MPELLEALNWLMRHTNSWGLEHDVALLHLYGYWKKCLEEDHCYLVMKVDKHDAEKNIIETEIFSDADRASEFSRKSTGANGALMTSPSQSTKALFDYGCKAQPSTAKSSGESDTTHVGEVCKGMTDSAVTELEHDLIIRAADRTKTAAIVCQRVAYPIQELLKWITVERNTTIPVSKLKLDASVAKAISISGESRALPFVRKTLAVDLMALKGPCTTSDSRRSTYPASTTWRTCGPRP